MVGIVVAQRARNTGMQNTRVKELAQNGVRCARKLERT